MGSVIIPNGRISEYWCGDVVPSGKRLIIENLAAKATYDVLDDIMVVFRGREVSGGDRDYTYLALTPSATTTGGLYHISNLNVKVRLGPGMTPCFIAMRTKAYSGAVSVSLTRTVYLVEAP